MGTAHRFTYWQGADGIYVGYPEDFPDYWTQAETLEELRENIADLLRERPSGAVTSDK